MNNQRNKKLLLIFLIIFFAIITSLVIIQNPFIANIDSYIKASIANYESPFVTQIMFSVTKVCNPFGTLVLFLIFGLFLKLKNNISFNIFTISIFSSILLAEIIKILTQRIRPESILLAEQGFSFPSYHATVATIFLLSSFYLLAPEIKEIFSKKIFLTTTAILFPLVAFSRIYLSIHWTSDVVAGIILGYICFLTSSIIIERNHHRID